MTTCVICHSETRRVFKKHSYWVRECHLCKHRSAEVEIGEEHVKHIYANSYFTSGGAGYPDYIAECELITAHGKYYGALLNQFTSPGKLLDIGAAAGFVLEGLASQGWNGMGIEPNEMMSAHARSRGLHVKTGAFESISIDLKFNAVTMIQVIDHLYDVRRSLAKAARLTKPGGYWLIETWNKDSTLARLCGQHWHHYSPPSALNWFSPNTLCRLALEFGFECIAKGRPPKQLKASHLKSAFYYMTRDFRLGRAASAALMRVPDRWTISYPSYDLFWMLFKENRVSSETSDGLA